ncbi:PREDICTED: putative disease resistance protein At1g59780-like [Fragaria vesca subsp. vesca]
MEDVAYDCLTELVERSMVQVVNYGLTGKVKTCRLHYLMRDLCLQKAKEEDFLDVVDFSTGRRLTGNKVGRLVLYLDHESECEFSGKGGRNGHIRSLLYFNPPRFRWSKRVIRSVFNDFRLLRVLKFENLRREFELPKTIGNLVHLRFLSLRDSEFRALPSSVYKLILLQTLDLRGHFKYGWRIIKITNVFLNMEQLRHLYLPAEHTVSGRKLSFAKLCNLQTLVNVRIEKCNLNDLVRLPNLKKLGIIASRSSQLEKLKEMLVSEKLPEKLRGYPDLTKITLRSTKLKGDQIEIVEKLPKLRVLYLGFNSFESETMVFSQGGFPHLEFLTLRALFDLKEWRVEKEAMPCLHRLRIEWCDELQAIPDGLQDVTTLKELTINGMRRRFCRRVEEGGEDFYKIKHVPSLIITNIDLLLHLLMRKQRKYKLLPLLTSLVNKSTSRCFLNIYSQLQPLLYRFKFFPYEPNIGVMTIKNYIKGLVQEDTDKAVLIVQQNLTRFAKRFISELRI